MGEILASRWTLGKAGMRLRVMETGPLRLSQVTMPLSLFKNRVVLAALSSAKNPHAMNS
jgi:hypothetical protein